MGRYVRKYPSPAADYVALDVGGVLSDKEKDFYDGDSIYKSAMEGCYMFCTLKARTGRFPWLISRVNYPRRNHWVHRFARSLGLDDSKVILVREASEKGWWTQKMTCVVDDQWQPLKSMAHGAKDTLIAAIWFVDDRTPIPQGGDNELVARRAFLINDFTTLEQFLRLQCSPRALEVFQRGPPHGPHSDELVREALAALETTTKTEERQAAAAAEVDAAAAKDAADHGVDFTEDDDDDDGRRDKTAAASAERPSSSVAASATPASEAAAAEPDSEPSSAAAASAVPASPPAGLPLTKTEGTNEGPLEPVDDDEETSSSSDDDNDDDNDDDKEARKKREKSDESREARTAAKKKRVTLMPAEPPSAVTLTERPATQSDLENVVHQLRTEIQSSVASAVAGSSSSATPRPTPPSWQTAGRSMGSGWANRKAERSWQHRQRGGQQPPRVLDLPMCKGCERNQPGARCAGQLCRQCCWDPNSPQHAG